VTAFGQVRLDPRDPQYPERLAEHATRSQNGELPFRKLQLAGPILNLPVRAVTSDETVRDDDFVVLADATGAALALTLPAASTGRRLLGVVRTNAGANAVTITAAGGDSILGAGTYPLGSQWASALLCSDGVSQWVFL